LTISPGVTTSLRPAALKSVVVLGLVLTLGAPSVRAQSDTPACPGPTTDAGSVVAQPTPIPPPIRARVDGPAGVVALTFDAGADRGYAEDILDTLSDNQIPATFGMTGRWAQANPALVQRMAADGHMVIDHTFDHRSFTGLSDQLGGLSATQRQNEVLEADAIIAPLIGHTTCPWYRLPYGDNDSRVVGDMTAVGYTQQVGWTVDTLGWRGVPVQSIVSRSLRLAAPNAVYVMHVGIESRDGPALQQVIDGLRAQGYGFATVAALDPD
jgi:peptidoglycan/xylan/chitin deacetylase (PgdA/CDA1 family)